MEIQRFALSAQLDYTPESMDRFVDLCEQAILAITDIRHVRFLLKTAVDELTLNAMEHGYGRLSGTVAVTIEHAGTELLFEISDFGKGIDPARVRFDRVAQTEDDLRSRGWAFSILDKLTSGVHIRQNQPHGTCISLRIPLTEPAEPTEPADSLGLQEM